MKLLRISTAQLLGLLLAILVFLLACTSSQTPTSLQVQTGSGALPTRLPMVVATPPDALPTNPPSPLFSPLPTQNAAWLVFENGYGVSFRYPQGWDVLYQEPPEKTPEFSFDVSRPNAFHWIQVSGRLIPKTEEATLYDFAGDTQQTQGWGTNQTVWDQQITSRNQLDWHLAIRGFSRLIPTNYDEVAYIGQEGGLTEGTLVAIHYDAHRELAIQISEALDLDMLIALHEVGPEAVYPDMVPVFEEMLQSIALQPE